MVLSAVSLLAETPAAASPKNCDLIVTPPEQTTWLQRVLCESLELESLSIVEGQSTWRLHVVLEVLNDDGNLSDALLLAAVAALRDTTLPETTINPEGIVSPDDKGTCLNMAESGFVIPLTVGLVGDIILVNPTKMEQEHVVESNMTVVINSKTMQVADLNLSGTASVSSQQLALVTQMAVGRAKEVAALLQ